jgi:hypothetical protein
MILFCLFAGCGECKDTYGWLRSGKDMLGMAWNLIFYEIVQHTKQLQGR